jgi:hypothetical protein
VETKEIIELLEQRGNSKAAQVLRAEAAAETLRSLGRTDLADQLSTPEAPSNGARDQPAETEADEFLRQLRSAAESGWVSSPGLLDR